MSEESVGRTSIQVIERMMQLLDALAEHQDPVALKDLQFGESPIERT